MQFTDEHLEPFGKMLLELSVPTQLSFKTPMVYRMVKELTEAECLPWTGSHRAELCFDEAVANAMLHGNNLDPNKKVRALLFADETNWGAIIEDEGAGFGPEDLPDPDSEDFIFREVGRGIMLIESYVDDVKYNPQENRFMIVRKRQTEPDAAESEAAVAVDEGAPAGIADGAVSVADAGEVTVIEVTAPRIDGDNVNEVRDALNETVETARLMCLDMSRVEYISSVGLGTLVGFYKLVRSKDARMVIAGLQAAVRDIMESAHLLKLFEIVSDRDAALAKLRKQT